MLYTFEKYLVLIFTFNWRDVYILFYIKNDYRRSLWSRFNNNEFAKDCNDDGDGTG